MIRFRDYVQQRDDMNESLVQKGAVALYAAQARRYGDEAVRSYGRAKQTLSNVANTKSVDVKFDALSLALRDLLDGLISQRYQIGNVSAQITSATILNR